MGDVLDDEIDGAASGFPAWVAARTYERSRRAAVRREPPPAGRPLRHSGRGERPRATRSSCTARRCPTTTTSTADAAWRADATTSRRPALRWRSSSTPNPCGIAVGSDVADAHRQGPPPATRSVRLRRRHQPPTGPVSARDGPAGRREDLHRGASSPRRTSPTRWPCSSCCRRSPAIRLLVTQRGVRSATRHGDAGPMSAVGLLRADRGPPWTPPATTRRAWTHVQTGEAVRRGHPGRPRLRLARRSARPSPTRSCWPHGGATVGVGMGQVNRVDACPAGRVERAGERAARVRWPRATRSSPSPTVPRCLSPPGFGRSSSPADRCATTRRSPRAKEADVALYFTGTRHFAH